MLRTATVCIIVAIAATCAQAQELFMGKDGSIVNIDPRAMVADNGEMYLATKRAVYRAIGDKGRWESVFALPPGENEITCLGGNARTVFAGTRRGLYRTIDFGRTWRNVFKTIVPEKSNVLWIEASELSRGNLIIGTAKGVYSSADDGQTWRDDSANLTNKAVRCLARLGAELYACAEDGLYMTVDASAGWERLSVTSAPEGCAESSSSDDGQEAGGEGEEEPSEVRSVNCIALKKKRIYVGLDKSILVSDDGGKTWVDFPSQGIAGAITCLRPSLTSDRIFCATSRGVYIYDPRTPEDGSNRWDQIYKGTDAVLNTHSIVWAGETERPLWALTDHGLYRLEWMPTEPAKAIDINPQTKTFSIIDDSEPTFKELQKAAMHYAEVDPDKISRWRSQARLKALIPKISIGIDHGTNTNNEIYTSATSRYVVEGPADMDDGWDASISWELADLVFSTDQTSIDVRSRLTTQLRNDILDDLRRAYFERKRLRHEIIINPPKDERLLFEKDLRIQELTQAIDDLTGNYLSDHSKTQQGS